MRKFGMQASICRAAAVRQLMTDDMFRLLQDYVYVIIHEGKRPNLTGVWCSPAGVK
jgi:hypothetical protein